MKLKQLFLLIYLLSCFLVNAQNPYPQDYFRNPLDVTMVLSGSFAELRSNHFHAGLDIKTQQRTGLKVYTAAKGYVSRIKITHFGYGKALYITHPNGYTTVYAHLQKFSDKIESYVKQRQYEKESFEIELFPSADELVIEPEEIIAYSGNTGGSGGPHLHFEIRDKKERPMNPMMFGINIKDTRKPIVLRAFAYPIGNESHVNNNNERSELRLIKQDNGDFKVEPFIGYGKIGIGIVTYDRQDLAANKNGVNNIQSFFNGNKKIEIDFSRFSFDESKHINRLIDYEIYKNENSRVQKLFVQPNNPLSIYKEIYDDGYITVEDSTSSIFKIKVTDYKNNDSWITIPIKGQNSVDFTKKIIPVTDHFIYSAEANTLEKGHVKVTFPKDTFYDDFYLDFDVNSDTLKLHRPTIPAQRYFYINFDVSKYQGDHRNKLFIASVSKYGKLYYAPTKREGNNLVCRTKNLGTYTLARDTIGPKISATNFQDRKWLSKYRYLKLKIEDETSGIKNYRATINGKWILMEYDYKKKSLVYDFNDAIIKETENNLKLIVTDNVGNSTTFETTFYRK